MKVLAAKEGLAIRATVATADLPQDTVVSITADGKVDKCAADGHPIGRLVVPATETNGIGTVETRCKELVECEADGSVTAGGWVKIGAHSPTTGKNTVKAWTEGSDTVTGDSHKRLFGVVWIGGADEATVQVLTF